MRIDLRGNAVAAMVEQLVVGATFFIFYGLLIRAVGADMVGILSLVLVLASIGSMASAGFASATAHFLPLFEGRQDRRATVLCIETALLCTCALYAAIIAAAWMPFTTLVSAQAGAEYTLLVRRLMIPAGIYVFLLGIGATTALALTALHKSTMRLWASLAAAAAGLGVLLGATPIVGVEAGLWGLVAQSAIGFVVNWIQLRRILPELSHLPRRFDRPMAGKLLQLGINMQAQSMLVAGVEPLSRLMIGQFGSLGTVTYFSMASRFVLQMRALIYAGSQPLLSAFSYARTTAPDELPALYGRASAVVGFLALITMSGTAGAAPFVGEVWIGHRNNDFVIFTILLAAGWLVNTMTLSAYFNAYASGRMIISLVGHVLMFALNIALGLSLGLEFGAIGVVAGMALALLASGLFMGIGNSRHAPSLVGRSALGSHLMLGGLCLVAAITSIASYAWLRHVASPIISGIGCGMVWLAIVSPAVFLHDAARLILPSFRSARANGELRD